MNRIEALRILGLDEDASIDDIKIAYKETVQILHPDRFATNKKLQERATEQFKNLQAAYDFLVSGKSAKKARTSSSGGPGTSSSGTSRGSTSESQLEARLAGITAARTQLVAQRDTLLDERRNGIIMTVIGALVALITGRRPFGIFGAVAAIASAAAVWGVVSTVSAQKTLNNLDQHIKELKDEQRRIETQLDDL